MNKLLPEVIEITKDAGKLIMSYYRSAFDVTDKSPDNPVTDADFAADALLRERLLALLPEAGWLSEETRDNPNRLEKEYVWVVDPLDGTKEFVMGIPELAVSVGLVQNGKAVMGAVYNPATEELFYGSVGEGAFFNGQPAQLSQRSALVGAAIDASRSEIKRGEFEPFEAEMEIQIMGSIAYKMARVSAGLCDATWSRGPKNEWDICAGDFLIQEAGGRCSDLNDRSIHYNKPHPKVNGIIADNGKLHSEIAGIIAEIGAARTEPGL